MKFKVGDRVKITLGIIGVITECISGRKKTTYRIMIENNYILCDEADLSLVPE
jgi:DNA replicative helicase MCM subunit Mcm2 (Cdc46/Mcm family)